MPPDCLVLLISIRYLSEGILARVTPMLGHYLIIGIWYPRNPFINVTKQTQDLHHSNIYQIEIKSIMKFRSSLLGHSRALKPYKNWSGMTPSICFCNHMIPITWNVIVASWYARSPQAHSIFLNMTLWPCSKTSTLWPGKLFHIFVCQKSR